MRYKQLVKPNVHIPAPPGWCLTYVQNTFNAPWAGATATDGWEMTKYKHEGTPPKGISVPVWFAMKGEPAGHVVTWMEDGSIWSASDNDPQADYHPNLQHLLDFYGGRLTLRGWSEDIGGLRIVRKEDDMISIGGLNRIYRLRLGRAPDASAKKTYVGKMTEDAVDSSVMKSKEYKDLVAAAKKGKVNITRFAPEDIRTVTPELVPEKLNAGYEEVKETLYRRKK